MDNNFNNGYVYTAPQQEPQAPKKNAIVSMALGIASIVLSESGILGLICAIISKVFHKKFMEENNYTDIGFSKAGRITSTVGLVFSIISLVSLAIFFIVFTVLLIGGGAAAISNPDFMDMLEEIFSM